MSLETAALLQWTTWLGAFWTVVWLARDGVESRGDALRLIVALGSGALFAHLGTVLVGPTRTPAGFSVLFVPCGVVAGGLTCRAPGSRERLARLTLPAFPLAFALARVGCLIAGCCSGAPGDEALRPPVALYEIGLLIGLHALLAWVPDRHQPAAGLAGIGLIRAALDPLRLQPDGQPLVAAAWIASAWIVVGAGMFVRSLRLSSQLSESISSIGFRARSAIAGSTVTSGFKSRRQR